MTSLKVYRLSAYVLTLTMPLLAAAQGLGEVINTTQRLLNSVIPLVMTLALIYFFWGLAQYILSAGDEDKKEQGRNIMIYGIIALFVMSAVWGLVALLNQTFLGGQSIPGPDVIPGVVN